MLSLKRCILILSCIGMGETFCKSDGSSSIEPSYFFMTGPLLTVEDMIGDSLELEQLFHDLSPQERQQFAESIALLSDAFLSALVESAALGEFFPPT